MKKHLKIGIITGMLADIVFLTHTFILKTITRSALNPKNQINLNYPRNLELFSTKGLTVIKIIIGLIVIFVVFFFIGTLISWLIEKSKKN